VYSSRWGSLRLRAEDRFLIGDYADKGVIIGMWDGESFVGHFTNGGNIGWFEFRFDGDSNFKSGEWAWIGSDRSTPWNLQRTKSESPTPDNMLMDE